MFVNPFLIAAAIIPAVFLLIKIYKADKFDKEPITLLISLVLLGILSTFAAVIVERIGTFLIDLFLPQNGLLYQLVDNFIIVACTEEGAKFILLKRRTWNCPSFNCRFDGVLYAVYVSLGFALWENIQYVLTYGIGTALLRTLTAIPGHACFGVFMGLLYSESKHSDHYGLQKRAQLFLKLSLIIPAFLHGLYDFAASYNTWQCTLFFILFIAVMFITAFLIVQKQSKKDYYL